MTLNEDDKYGFKDSQKERPFFEFEIDQKPIQKPVEHFKILKYLNSKDFEKTQLSFCFFCRAGLPCKEHEKKISQTKESKEEINDYIRTIIKSYDPFEFINKLTKEIPSTIMTRIYRLPNGEYSIRAPAEYKWDIQSLRTYLEFPEFSKFITGTLSLPPKQIGGIHLVHDVRDITAGNYITPTGANAYEVVGKVDSTPLTMPPATGLEAVIFFEINK